MEKQLNIYGIRPVLELIESGKEIDAIFLQKDIKAEWTNEIRKKAKEYKLNLKIVPKFKLNRFTNKNHQGIVAITSSVIFQNFDNLLALAFERGENPLFLLLDRITDVRNFGSICRSAEAMGTHGVIIPTRGSAQINEIAIKASAGAISNINICREDNLHKVIKIAKTSGLQILACSEKSNKNIYELNLNKPTLLIIGSEKDGIAKNILDISDEQVKIPISGKTQSLNAAVATGIILYEYNRQK